VKRFALRGGAAFVVFKDIKISLVPKALGIGFSRYFGIGRCKKEKKVNDIESWINLITSNYFSIQYSIENHLPTKERR
jgi:hypothetical protein